MNQLHPNTFERDLVTAILKSRQQRADRLEQITEKVQHENPASSWDDIQPLLAEAILTAGLQAFAELDRDRPLARHS